MEIGSHFIAQVDPELPTILPLLSRIPDYNQLQCSVSCFFFFFLLTGGLVDNDTLMFVMSIHLLITGTFWTLIQNIGDILLNRIRK